MNVNEGRGEEQKEQHWEHNEGECEEKRKRRCQLGKGWGREFDCVARLGLG